jgi:hypothetical protein
MVSRIVTPTRSCSRPDARPPLSNAEGRSAILADLCTGNRWRDRFVVDVANGPRTDVSIAGVQATFA